MTSLRTKAAPLDEQIRVVEALIIRFHSQPDAGPDDRQAERALKAVAAALRARAEAPRSLPLGELERALRPLIGLPKGTRAPADDLARIGRVVIHRWAFIRQALEHFGEEVAQ